MMTEGTGLRDEVVAVVRRVLPPRPPRSASKRDWVDYVVALGADRHGAAGHTKKELRELATRFGG